jgi:hypothetical protein
VIFYGDLYGKMASQELVLAGLDKFLGPLLNIPIVKKVKINLGLKPRTYNSI